MTAHPTAEWIARQLTEACGWEPVVTASHSGDQPRGPFGFALFDGRVGLTQYLMPPDEVVAAIASGSTR